jgi:hypothetical protein
VLPPAGVVFPDGGVFDVRVVEVGVLVVLEAVCVDVGFFVGGVVLRDEGVADVGAFVAVGVLVAVGTVVEVADVVVGCCVGVINADPAVPPPSRVARTAVGPAMAATTTTAAAVMTKPRRSIRDNPPSSSASRRRCPPKRTGPVSGSTGFSAAAADDAVVAAPTAAGAALAGVAVVDRAVVVFG